MINGELNRKDRRELEVCRLFLRNYNKASNCDYVGLEPGEDPPDCICYSSRDEKERLQLEVMKSSPKEAKNLGRNGWHEAVITEKVISVKARELFSSIEENKANHYSSEFKSQTILLLDEAVIHYGENSEIKLVLEAVKAMMESKNLGFKEIWYVEDSFCFQLN